jgi:hypothetical protein
MLHSAQYMCPALVPRHQCYYIAAKAQVWSGETETPLWSKAHCLANYGLGMLGISQTMHSSSTCCTLLTSAVQCMILREHNFGQVVSMPSSVPIPGRGRAARLATMSMGTLGTACRYSCLTATATLTGSASPSRRMTSSRGRLSSAHASAMRHYNVNQRSWDWLLPYSTEQQ